MNNFTLSDNWIEGILKRYDNKNIINMYEIYFWKDEKLLKCQHFFDFDISNDTLEIMAEYIEKGIKIRFSYLDNDKLYTKLKKWCNEKKYTFNIVDEWNAPRLELLKDSDNITEYLNKNKSSQIRRNFKDYLKNRKDYRIVSSNNKNILDLWNDVLYIDCNSWKGKKHCDMQSLNREDLQYIFYLINNFENASLNVLYKDDLPLAYSLMFRANENSMWYAVKWGASDEGRKTKTGFYCLFNHLEMIYHEKNELILDFWGRRSQTYDYLKNNEILRSHIEIGK